MRALPVLSWSLLSALLPAQAVTLDAQFENGNLDGYAFTGTHYHVNSNNAPGAWQWLHFRVSGALGQTPRFKTDVSSAGDVYRPYHRMVWRPDGDANWRQMDHGDKPGDGFYYFWNNAPFTTDTVYIAYWLPYTYGRFVEWAVDLITADGRPEALGFGLAGVSRQGRPLLYLGITDPAVPNAAKRHFVVVARQHGYESLGNYALEGMVRFLLSEDPVAVKARQLGIYHFYPMANPDAVANGWTREGRARDGVTPVDFNRDWLRRSVGTGGAASASIEIDFLRADIMSRTGGAAAAVVDLHAHAKGSTGLGWYWWHHDDPAAALAFVTAVWDADRALHGGQTVYSWPQPTAGGNSTTLGAWGSSVASGNTIATLGADSFTLEPIAAPFGAVRDAERIRMAGEAVARALAQRY